MKLFYGLLAGITMGVLIQRVGASNPRMILASLRLRDLTIIKFMATTIAVASVLVYLAGGLGLSMNMDVKPTYVLGVAIGGLIFGAGFAIGGFCPGTCVVGSAEGRRDAWVALLGGVVGALAFTLMYRMIETPLIKPLAYGRITWADVFHVPALRVSVTMAALILLTVRILPTRRQGPAA